MPAGTILWLLPTDAPSAAGVGEKAQESLIGADRYPNSLFTRVLLRRLTAPNVGLVAAAQATRREVARLAAGIGRTKVPGVFRRYWEKGMRTKSI